VENGDQISLITGRIAVLFNEESASYEVRSFGDQGRERTRKNIE